MTDVEPRKVLQPVSNNRSSTRAAAKRKSSTPVLTDRLRIQTPSFGRLSRQTPRTKNRFTPYRHTPKTRQLRSTKSKRTLTHTESSHTGDGAYISELLKKTWRLYTVSPLHKFCADKKDLRRYSRLLSAHITAELEKGAGVETESADTADISQLHGLKTNEDEPDALRISLKQKNQGGLDRVVLSAVLCSVGARLDDLQNVDKAFTHFPVMLVRGPVTLGRHLASWLKMEFDCCVSALRFTSIELSWMVAMWAETAPDKSNRMVHLNYKVPSEVQNMSTIEIEINAKDCCKLWKSVHVSHDDTFCMGEVRNFVLSIEEHFYHHFRIDLSCMSLWRVATATAYIGSEGKLKLFSAAHIQQVMTHLTELATERKLLTR